MHLPRVGRLVFASIQNSLEYLKQNALYLYMSRAILNIASTEELSGLGGHRREKNPLAGMSTPNWGGGHNWS